MFSPAVFLALLLTSPDDIRVQPGFVMYRVDIQAMPAGVLKKGEAVDVVHWVDSGKKTPSQAVILLEKAPIAAFATVADRHGVRVQDRVFLLVTYTQSEKILAARTGKLILVPRDE